MLWFFIVGEVGEALSLSSDEFEAKYQVAKPSHDDANIVFHCRSGVRSREAMSVAMEMGYTKYVLLGIHMPTPLKVFLFLCIRGKRCC